MQKEAAHEPVIEWNLPSMLERDEEASQDLWNELETEGTRLGEESTVDKLE
jgi:hypothetical protein